MSSSNVLNHDLPIPFRGRIAGLAPEVIRTAKTAVDGHSLATENEALTGLFTADTVTRAHQLLAAGVQTRAGKLRLEDLIDDIR